MKFMLKFVKRIRVNINNSKHIWV